MGCIYKRGDVFWVKYRAGGRSHYESSGSTRKKDAKELLQRREGKAVDGVPVSAAIGRLTYDDAAADLIMDYKNNAKRSLAVVERRITKHLTPFFTGRKMAAISTADVRRYVAHRQEQGIVAVRGPQAGQRVKGVSNGEINRELALLKRMFSLSIEAGLLFHKIAIPMLAENNVRQGFFEPDQLNAVLQHLPADLQPVIEFAGISGWRIASEVLPLQWHQVDFAAGEVRLDKGTTKNGEGRTFVMTTDLRKLLEARRVAHRELAKAGTICPHVFYRMTAEGRGGDKKPVAVMTFDKAWKTATRKAGCPGRIPHDLRRTAIRRMVRAGISESVAMKLSGHKTRSVFERYNVTSGSDLHEAARKLDAPSSTIQSATA